MSGNLYTHIVRRNDPKIEILSKLKQEYNSNPRNWENIKKLKLELKRMEKNKKKRQPQKSPIKQLGTIEFYRLQRQGS